MDAEQHRDLRNAIDAAALLARDLEGYLDAADRGPAGPEVRAAARRTAHEADELRAQLEERRHAAGG
jgi:hypothetical protein